MKHTCWSGVHSKAELNMNFKKGCINVLLFSLIIKPTCHLNKLPEMMYFTLVFLPWIPHVLWFSFESTHYVPPFLIHNMTMFPPLSQPTIHYPYQLFLLTGCTSQQRHPHAKSWHVLWPPVESFCQSSLDAEQEVRQYHLSGQNAWSVTPAHSDQCRGLWIAIPRTHSKRWGKIKCQIRP